MSSENDLIIYTEHFPPYNYKDGTNIVGINADLVRHLCLESNLRCTFELLPWNRAFKLARQTPNSGLVSTSKNEQRSPLFKWVGPIVYGQSRFYYLASRADIQINSLEDAKKYNTGIPNQDVYEPVLEKLGFQKGVNLLSTSTKHETVRLLKLGKLDLVIGSALTLPYQAKEYGIDPTTLVASVVIPDENFMGNFLALNLGVDDAIVTRLQRSLDEAKRSQKYQQIIAQYHQKERNLLRSSDHP